MFYTAVFLAGEWAQTDFTWPGKILCCALCVMGIALFAIPVGTVFEAFQDVLQEVNVEDDDDPEGEGGVACDGSYSINIGEKVGRSEGI